MTSPVARETAAVPAVTWGRALERLTVRQVRSFRRMFAGDVMGQQFARARAAAIEARLSVLESEAHANGGRRAGSAGRIASRELRSWLSDPALKSIVREAARDELERRALDLDDLDDLDPLEASAGVARHDDRELHTEPPPLLELVRTLVCAPSAPGTSASA